MGLIQTETVSSLKDKRYVSGKLVLTTAIGVLPTLSSSTHSLQAQRTILRSDH
jgi:hypothetical protein